MAYWQPRRVQSFQSQKVANLGILQPLYLLWLPVYGLSGNAGQPAHSNSGP